MKGENVMSVLNLDPDFKLKKDEGLLETVFYNGELIKKTNLKQIRERLNGK